MPDVDPGETPEGIGEDGQPLWEWLKARDEAIAAHPERFAKSAVELTPEPDYGAEEYMRLPDFGVGHYSLEDAALLSALDMWASNEAPGVPAEGLPMADDDDEVHDQQDDPLIRAALDPLRAQLLAALVRSAEAGQLDVVVRGRTLADSRLIPELTFVHLSDLVEWLGVYGHERGDIIADEESASDPWETALKVAEDRARLRLAHLEPRPSAGEPWTDADGLRTELRAKRLHIAHLERQLEEAQRGGRAVNKSVTTRERRSLLVVIAALCKRARIDPVARGAAVEIASATDELGVPVGDDTIRGMLKLIPDALG